MMSWFRDGHVKYPWEWSRFQKVVSIFVSVLLWLGLWALLNIASFGSVLP